MKHKHKTDQLYSEDDAPKKGLNFVLKYFTFSG